VGINLIKECEMNRIKNKEQVTYQIVYEFSTPAAQESTFTVQFVRNTDLLFAGFSKSYHIYISGEMYSYCLTCKIDIKEFLIKELMLTFNTQAIARSSVHIHVKDFSINCLYWL